MIITDAPAGAAERRMIVGYCKLKKGICDTYYPCKVCPHSKITNADRIRAMSDEELAAWLESLTPHDCGCCAYQQACRFEHDTETVDYTEKYHCGEGIMAWLQQPAEEVHHV